jgi:hypothetical protein
MSNWGRSAATNGPLSASWQPRLAIANSVITTTPAPSTYLPHDVRDNRSRLYECLNHSHGILTLLSCELIVRSADFKGVVTFHSAGTGESGA